MTWQLDRSGPSALLEPVWGTSARTRSTTSIASLTSIIEPLLMMGVGALIGIIVSAIYLPMFELLELVR